MTYHLDIFMSGKNLGLNGLSSVKLLLKKFNSIYENLDERHKAK